MDLAASSIWDAAAGFGGDGDPHGDEIVGGGRCVTDGPFTALRPIIYNHTYTTHCVARGFRDADADGRIPGAKFRPENIGAILRAQTYGEFVAAVEADLHNTLHQAVNGDFKAMTAANGKFPLPPSQTQLKKGYKGANQYRSPVLRSPRPARPYVVAVAAGRPREAAT